MFDLFRSRAKAVRYLLTVLLGLVALSMVTYLIPGSGMGRYSDDTIVAEVGGEALTMRDVQMQLQQQIRGRTIPPEMVSILVPQFVNQMINERAVAYEAQRLGFDVTEDDLALAIRSIFPQLFPEGKFVGADVYRAMLGQQNLTIPEFESNLRKQLLLNKLENLAMEGVVVAPAEVEEEFRRRNEKVKLDYIALSSDKYRSQASASAQEIKDYFARHPSSYSIPEKRNIDLVVADEAKITAATVIPDTELRRVYEANKERYRTPERVHVRHILLKTTDKSKEEIPKVQARAEDLLKQIKGGADFAELAKKNSDDTGSAVKGGDLDWVARGQTVKNFEDTAFSLKPNEISNVIKTEYGFHIIQVLEKQAAQVKPFEAVKGDLATERKKQVVYEKMQTASEQARQMLAKTPLDAEAIAQKLGLELVRMDQFAFGDKMFGIGPNPDVENAIKELKRGEVSQVVQTGNKLVVTVVKDIFQPRPAQLSEVEAKVRDAVLDEKAAQLLEQKTKEAAEKLKSNGGDLKQLAKTLGLEVKTTGEFGPDGAAEGVGPANVLAEAFTKNVGAIIGPVRVDNKNVFAKLEAKIPADRSKLAAERGAILERLKGRKATERKELFEDSVVTQLIKEGKLKIHKDAVQRLIANYQG